MELTIFKSNIPIKAIPPEKLEEMIIGIEGSDKPSLVTWLSDLLSLTDEVSAKRLFIALPALKDLCWSMGFDEITKMFEMYADSKLSVKPLPNYFDRILLGKIVVSYKQQKQVKGDKTNEEKEKEYKDNQDILYSIQAFDYWVQEGVLLLQSYWMYEYLKGKGVINYTDDAIREAFKIAKQDYEEEEIAIQKGKCLLVEDHFKTLKEKGLHIKNQL